MPPARPPVDFAAALGLLSRGGVEFVVVGGFAATAHGSARVTYDLDVVYSRRRDNIARLLSGTERRLGQRASA